MDLVGLHGPFCAEGSHGLTAPEPGVNCAAEGSSPFRPAVSAAIGSDNLVGVGKPIRPDVAAAFDRMAAAARREAGLYLSVSSGFRSDAEEQILWNANPNPKWVAPPGTSLHRYATELDLGPSTAYPWLETNHRRFGFVWRYKWEPWH